MRQNPKIKGIRLDQDCVKTLSQYANDSWTATEFEVQSFHAVLGEFKEFEEFSGLKINYSKTEILRTGALKKSDARFYSRLPLHCSDGPIKILSMMYILILSKCVRLIMRSYWKKLKILLKSGRTILCL